jgi:hypothetical protein
MFLKRAFIAAVFILTMARAALAGEAQYVDTGAGPIDLVRAHNERMIVFFGEGISFKRYNVIDMLHQYFTVASEVKGGVRYQVHVQAGQKMLVID